MANIVLGTVVAFYRALFAPHRLLRTLLIIIVIRLLKPIVTIQLRLTVTTIRPLNHLARVVIPLLFLFLTSFMSFP